MSRLRIGLLGRLSVTADSSSKLVLSRKDKAVLAALALAGSEGLSRERLTDLFWSQRRDEQARASLRQSLAAIRKGLKGCRKCVLADLERVTLDWKTVEVDVHRFDALASSAKREDLEQASALYRGDLLDGVSLKEETFEAWIRPVRERLRVKASGVLSKLLDASCDNAERIVVATRLLELDPLNETAHRALMRAYAAQDRENAALKQFALCRDLLDRELGVAPSPETVRLFEQIQVARRGELSSADVAVPGMASVTNDRRSVKPTVVVLPFENLSDDQSGHVAAGITYDITTALLRHRWLCVIRATAMSGPGRYAMVIGGELVERDVDYLVAGSVRAAGEQMRIAAQLIDARSGEHIWSEKFDRRLHDMFALQDEVVAMIAARIEPEVAASERQRVQRRSTTNLSAWDCYHLGMAHYYKFTPAGNLEAHRLFGRSLAADPDFGEGHGWWSYTKVLSMVYFDADPNPVALDEALRAAQRAVEIDNQDAMFHALLARVYLAQREYSRTLAEMEIALDLNPNLPGIYCGLGDALAYQGRLPEAIRQFETALRLGPRDPLRWAFFAYGALAHIFAKNFDRALEWADNALSFPRCLFWAYAHRVAALGHLQRQDEARIAIAELRRKQPQFSVRFAERKLFFIKRKEQLELYLDGLRTAGLPER